MVSSQYIRILKLAPLRWCQSATVASRRWCGEAMTDSDLRTMAGMIFSTPGLVRLFIVVFSNTVPGKNNNKLGSGCPVVINHWRNHCSEMESLVLSSVNTFWCIEMFQFLDDCSLPYDPQQYLIKHHACRMYPMVSMVKLVQLVAPNYPPIVGFKNQYEPINQTFCTSLDIAARLPVPGVQLNAAIHWYQVFGVQPFGVDSVHGSVHSCY